MPNEKISAFWSYTERCFCLPMWRTSGAMNPLVPCRLLAPTGAMWVAIPKSVTLQWQREAGFRVHKRMLAALRLRNIIPCWWRNRSAAATSAAILKIVRRWMGLFFFSSGYSRDLHGASSKTRAIMGCMDTPTRQTRQGWCNCCSSFASHLSSVKASSFFVRYFLMATGLFCQVPRYTFPKHPFPRKLASSSW